MKAQPASYANLVLSLALILGWYIAGLSWEQAQLTGGTDMGKLYLAGATSLIKDGRYPIAQRPPLYSSWLALLTYINGMDAFDATQTAREYGNTRRFSVARELLDKPFRRLALWAQWVLLIGTVFILVIELTLRPEVPITWLPISLVPFALPSFWTSFAFIYDTILTQFLLTLGLAAFAVSLRRQLATGPLIITGLAFALVPLSRATFQLLTPLFAVLLGFALWPSFGVRKTLRGGLVLLVPWMALVGGWSLRNYATMDLCGISAPGISLGTKCTLFLDRAANVYPEETSAFVRIRNQLLVDSPEHTGTMWTDGACQWLIRHRGMTYAQANAFLVRVSTAAIVRAPQRYMYEVGKSLVSFHLPDAPRWLGKARPFVGLAEGFLLFVFIAANALWCSAHVFERIWNLHRQPSLVRLDLLISGVLCVYWYTALVTCAVDLGKPGHRAPVQFLLVLGIVLIARRLYASRSRCHARAPNDEAPSSSSSVAC